ncbi:MAG: nonstructural protein [Microvirus sp.]|nr:MAG: nonstructural protein [Microvirus sp.]
MKLVLYAIKDTVGEEFGPIFGAKNDATAYRSFAQTMADNKYPQEFLLHSVGTYNTETGIIEAFPQPQTLKVIDMTEKEI